MLKTYLLAGHNATPLLLALRLLETQPMLSLDELLEDPLLQMWDAHRVVTALNLALRQRRQPSIERWFFFSARA